MSAPHPTPPAAAATDDDALAPRVVGGASLMVAWRLAGRTVLVVGGGAVAAGRVRQALEADAAVVVVAPALGPELAARHARGELAWRPRPFAPADLDGADLVLACLDDPALSAELAREARARRLPINCADQPERCDFWFTSQHREGPLQLALSTGGAGPGLGARLLRELAAALPPEAAPALARFTALRARVRAQSPGPRDSPRRMAWLTALARRWPWPALAALDDDALDALTADYLAGAAPAPPSPQPDAAPQHTPTDPIHRPS